MGLDTAFTDYNKSGLEPGHFDFNVVFNFKVFTRCHVACSGLLVRQESLPRSRCWLVRMQSDITLKRPDKQ